MKKGEKMKKWTAVLAAIALMLPQTAMGAVWKDEASAADETAMEVISEEASEEASEEEGDGAFAGEQTVVDNDACKIVVTGLDPEGLWGYDVDVYLENKSEDVKYTYTLEYAAVNGLEMMTFMSEEVAAGKKANSNFTLDTDDLEEAGLTVDDVTDITLNFRVYDSDDWSADDAANETVHIYPNGKSEAVKYEREPQDTDIVLMDTGDFSVTVTRCYVDDIWGYTAELYLVNNTDQEVLFNAENVSVNGFMIDPYWATTAHPGCCIYSTMSWDSDDFESNGITDVEEIELELSVMNSSTWDDLYQNTLTFEPAPLAEG